MTAIFSDHFSIVYDICRAACHGDTALGRSSVKKLAALIESSTPDDAALLKRLTKKAAKNPAHFVQTATADDARDAVLAEIRYAIADYHFALDLRTHGGVAQDRAFNTICKSLDMHWKQGEEKARRALSAAGDAK